MAKTLSSYSSLVKTIRHTLQGGLITAQKAMDYARLTTYWQIGMDVRQAVANSNGALVAGEALYSKISQELYERDGLELKADTIKRAVYLSREYPHCPGQSSLGFTAYLVLCRVKDERARAALEKKAIKEGLVVEQLKDEVTRMKLALAPPVSRKRKLKKLPCHRGEPYVYKVERLDDLSGVRQFRIDCGFYVSMPFGGKIKETAPSVIEEAREVRVEKYNDMYIVELYRGGIDKRHTYLARVLKVIDGDTLDVAIDVGFGIVLRERIRLKRINAPEKNTAEGRMATRYLERLFKQNPYIVMRSSREGAFKRWIADVFVKEDTQDPYLIAAEGLFLNQHLIDEGLADKI